VRGGRDYPGHYTSETEGWLTWEDLLPGASLGTADAARTIAGGDGLARAGEGFSLEGKAEVSAAAAVEHLTRGVAHDLDLVLGATATATSAQQQPGYGERPSPDTSIVIDILSM